MSSDRQLLEKATLAAADELVLDREHAPEVAATVIKTVRAEITAQAVSDFLDHIASAHAYNGAGDPGQAFYNEGLNTWLQRAFVDYLRPDPAATQQETP